MTLGEKINEMRIEHGWSQAKLAELVGVTQKAIHFWEADENEPKASYLKKLTEAFNVPAAYLLGLDDSDTIFYSQKSEIQKLYDELPPDLQRTALSYLQGLADANSQGLPGAKTNRK